MDLACDPYPLLLYRLDHGNCSDGTHQAVQHSSRDATTYKSSITWGIETFLLVNVAVGMVAAIESRFREDPT